MEKIRRSTRKSMKEVEISNDLSSLIERDKEIMRATMAKDIKNEFDVHKEHITKTYDDGDDTPFSRTLNSIYRSTTFSDATCDESAESTGAIVGDVKVLVSNHADTEKVPLEKRRSIFGSPEITNFLVKDNLEKIKERQSLGGLFGGPQGANVDTENHHDPPDVSTANAVSNYYFTTTANRYANSPFT